MIIKDPVTVEDLLIVLELMTVENKVTVEDLATVEYLVPAEDLVTTIHVGMSGVSDAAPNLAAAI